MTNPTLERAARAATVGDVMKTLSRMGCPPWRLMYATGEAIGFVQKDEQGSSYLLHKGVRYHLDGRDEPEPTAPKPVDAS